jgi:hypothetical protein
MDARGPSIHPNLSIDFVNLRALGEQEKFAVIAGYIAQGFI